MKKKTDKCMGGNIYDKYSSKNPLIKLIINNFFKDIDFYLGSISIYSVLDVGCGEGYITDHIKKYNNNFKIEALDISREIIDIAILTHPEVSFSQGSIYNLPFKDNSFDLLVASEVLEHLEYPEKAIEEIKRVSRKYCIITVPNEPFFRIANIIRFKYLLSFGNTPGHMQNWTQSEFRELLKNNFDKFTVKLSTLWQIAFCEV